MRTEGGNNNIYISRRDLLTLLAKLDGFPENSACAISLAGEFPVYGLSEAEIEAMPKLIAEEYHQGEEELFINPETEDRMEEIKEAMAYDD